MTIPFVRGPNAVAPWRRLLGLVVVLVVGAVMIPAPPVADATSIVPFAPRFSANDNGSIAIFGNNLLTCPESADCTGARAATNNKNNNGFAMVSVDVDDDASTFSSSRAAVTLPDDGEVAWAGLYWGARLGAGAGGRPAVGNGRQMKLNPPGGGGYQTIAANQLFGPTTTSDRAYQSFAVVTDLVRQAGPGTYTGADVPAATGEDRYAGWSLVVVYRSPSLPLRNLTVFDGLADVGQGDPQPITISGFRTPVSGQVNARVGLVAYEGDNGSTGDRAILRDASNPGGTLLATRLSQGTNFFNGANDDNGTLVTARTPADRNMLGFDIKNFDGPGILGNSQSLGHDRPGQHQRALLPRCGDDGHRRVRPRLQSVDQVGRQPDRPDTRPGSVIGCATRSPSSTAVRTQRSTPRSSTRSRRVRRTCRDRWWSPPEPQAPSTPRPASACNPARSRSGGRSPSPSRSTSVRTRRRHRRVQRGDDHLRRGDGARAPAI